MRITFDGIYNHSSKDFEYYTILLTIDFVVDKQMSKSFISNDTVIGGYIEYSIGFLWLKFAFYINIEIKTK